MSVFDVVVSPTVLALPCLLLQPLQLQRISRSTRPSTGCAAQRVTYPDPQSSPCPDPAAHPSQPKNIIPFLPQNELITRLGAGGQSGRAATAEKALERMREEGLVGKPFVPKKRSFAFPAVDRMGCACCIHDKLRSVYSAICSPSRRVLVHGGGQYDACSVLRMPLVL